MERGRLIVCLLDGLFQSAVLPKSPFEIHPVRLGSRLRFLVTGRLANATTGICFPSFLSRVLVPSLLLLRDCLS